MKTSVALCTWNGGRHVAEQIRSILAQTRLPDQLVVRDDGSTDGTPENVKDILSDAPFRWSVEVNGSNLGSTLNFDAAIRDCDGDAVFLCDQDDIWEIDKIEIMAARLESREEPSFVFSDARLVDGDGCLLPGSLWKRVGFSERRRRSFNSGMQMEQLLRGPFVTGCMSAFRRSVLTEAMPFDRRWIHDYWACLHAVGLGGRGEALARPLARYRLHQGQQVGVTLRAARASAPLRAYIDDAIRWRDLSDRLRILAGRSPDLDLLEERAEHAAFRAAIRDAALPFRGGRVFARFLRGRYRFDFSRLAWLRDLLVP